LSLEGYDLKCMIGKIIISILNKLFIKDKIEKRNICEFLYIVV